MEFFETSKYFSLKKSTYINLRWIGIIGQLITVNSVYFILDFKFNFLFTNIIIILGIISNLYLIYIYQKTQLSAKSAFFFLLIDILQLSFLIYLTGGITNPFSIFLIIPSIFSSSNLDLKTNLLLATITISAIIFLTFFHSELPSPLNEHFHVSFYYYYSIPIALIVALIFLIYFAITFGNESRLRKEALNKIEEVMAKEHELVSLGGQAAAAAHSLGTPLFALLLRLFVPMTILLIGYILIPSRISKIPFIGAALLGLILILAICLKSSSRSDILYLLMGLVVLGASTFEISKVKLLGGAAVGSIFGLLLGQIMLLQRGSIDGNIFDLLGMVFQQIGYLDEAALTMFVSQDYFAPAATLVMSIEKEIIIPAAAIKSNFSNFFCYFIFCNL